MDNYLLELVRLQKSGRPVGIYSACTANRHVIKAVMQRAAAAGQPALIEATANQVDQNGGYTGMTPEMFVRYVEEIAAEMNFPMDSVILGGDHFEERAADQFIERIPKHICQTLVDVSQLPRFNNKYPVLQAIEQNLVTLAREP